MLAVLWVVGSVGNQIMNLFKIQDYSQRKRVKTVYWDGKKPSKLKIQKLSEDNITKNIRNLLKLKKQDKATKRRIIRDIKNLFEQQEENYYKSVRVQKFWNNICIEYESSGNRKILQNAIRGKFS